MTDSTASLSASSPPQSAPQPDYRLKWLEACELLESTTSALAEEYERNYHSVVLYPKRGKRYGAAGAARSYLDRHIPELLAVVREVRR